MKPLAHHNIGRHINIRAIPSGPPPAPPKFETREQRLARRLNQMPASAFRPGCESLLLKFLAKSEASEAAKRGE
jgi:hypothetical protein